MGLQRLPLVKYVTKIASLDIKGLKNLPIKCLALDGHSITFINLIKNKQRKKQTKMENIC